MWSPRCCPPCPPTTRATARCWGARPSFPAVSSLLETWAPWGAVRAGRDQVSSGVQGEPGQHFAPGRRLWLPRPPQRGALRPSAPRRGREHRRLGSRDLSEQGSRLPQMHLLLPAYRPPAGVQRDPKLQNDFLSPRLLPLPSTVPASAHLHTAHARAHTPATATTQRLFVQAGEWGLGTPAHELVPGTPPSARAAAGPAPAHAALGSQ